MLGAQALRTKQRFQKAEQKEKEKRHRERLKSIEIQRDKMHRAACEEAAANFLEIAAQPPLKLKQHRHSVHTSTANHLNITQDQFEKLKLSSHENSHEKKSNKSSGPQRSTSSDQCRLPDKKNSVSNSNKFLKWLGLAGKEQDTSQEDFKQLKKRRMSTFT